MQRLIMQLISVVVIIPFIFNYILVMFAPSGYRQKPGSIEQFKDTIAYAEEYFIRFIAQTIALVIFF